MSHKEAGRDLHNDDDDDDDDDGDDDDDDDDDDDQKSGGHPRTHFGVTSTHRHNFERLFPPRVIRAHSLESHAHTGHFPGSHVHTGRNGSRVTCTHR